MPSLNIAFFPMFVCRWLNFRFGQTKKTFPSWDIWCDTKNLKRKHVRIIIDRKRKITIHLGKSFLCVLWANCKSRDIDEMHLKVRDACIYDARWRTLSICDQFQWCERGLLEFFSAASVSISSPFFLSYINLQKQKIQPVIIAPVITNLSGCALIH